MRRVNQIRWRLKRLPNTLEINPVRIRLDYPKSDGRISEIHQKDCPNARVISLFETARF